MCGGTTCSTTATVVRCDAESWSRFVSDRRIGDSARKQTNVTAPIATIVIRSHRCEERPGVIARGCMFRFYPMGDIKNPVGLAKTTGPQRTGGPSASRRHVPRDNQNLYASPSVSVSWSLPIGPNGMLDLSCRYSSLET